jgi:hypothetical protein
MARNKVERLHEPVASETQRDTVPVEALPPLSAFDRRSDGERLGACPACGGVRWWDNRAKKRAAQLSSDSPDFTCVQCRAPHSEADPPNPPGAAVTTVLPAEPVGRAGRSGGGGQCAKVKADGQRCRGGAMAGSDFCGPHSGAVGAPPNRCQGVTKAGKPCAAGAPKGERFCLAHASQAP